MQDSTYRPYTFDRVVRILATIAIIAAAIWLINLLRNVLLPFVVACLVAYLLDPLVELNRKWLHLKGRGLASLITLLEVTFIIALLGYFFVPSVIKEVNQLESMVKQSSQGSPIPFIPEDIAAPVRKWVSDFNISNLM